MWGKEDILNDHHSIGSGLILAYKGHPQADSVSLLFTEFRDYNGGCEINETYCGGSLPFCVPRWLRCNKENNCGSGDTDERDCSTRTNLRPLSPESTDSSIGLIGALIGIFVTMIIVTISALIVFFCKRREHDRQSWYQHHGRQSVHSLSRLRKQPVENYYARNPTHGNQVNLNHSESTNDIEVDLNAMAVEEPEYDDIDDSHMNPESPEPINHIYAEPMERTGDRASSSHISNLPNSPNYQTRQLNPNGLSTNQTGEMHESQNISLQPNESPIDHDGQDDFVLLDWSQPLSERIVRNLNARPRDLL